MKEKMFRKSIRKALIPLVLCFSLIVMLFPNSTSAAGWDYNLNSNQHWGSSGCQTSYDYINFTVNQYSGESFIWLEKLVGGNWTPVWNYSETIWGNGVKNYHRVKVDSPNSQYRIFIQSGTFGFNTVGNVKCFGSNS